MCCFQWRHYPKLLTVALLLTSFLMGAGSLGLVNKVGGWSKGSVSEQAKAARARKSHRIAKSHSLLLFLSSFLWAVRCLPLGSQHGRRAPRARRHSRPSQGHKGNRRVRARESRVRLRLTCSHVSLSFFLSCAAPRAIRGQGRTILRGQVARQDCGQSRPVRAINSQNRSQIISVTLTFCIPLLDRTFSRVSCLPDGLER